MSEYEGKVVVITGGGGGIGKAAAARFLDEGASVVLSSRRRGVLEVARRELDADDRIALVPGDVSSPRAAAELIEEALDSILRPTFYTSQAAARRMVERGRGAIVNVGSMWALDAITTTPTSAYSAAQAGRHALTKNLAIELAPANIRVNTVALAFVETPAYERFMTAEQAQSVLESVNAFHPLGRHGYPADVVEAILFLAGNRAGWITGTTLPIDGGVLAGRNAPPAPVPAESRA